MGEYRCIGVITRPVGLKGDVMLHAFDEDYAWLNKVKRFWVGPETALAKPMTLKQYRWQGQNLIIQLTEISDRNRSEAIKGHKVYALQEDLPALAADEYYADSLVDFEIHSRDSGRLLGRVRSIASAVAGDFIEITPADTGQSVLIPFEPTFIDDVEPDKNIIWIKGLDALFPEPEKTV